MSDEGRIEQLPDGKVRWMSRTSFHGSGWIFSIYDVEQIASRIRRVAHESLEATHRVFVMADGCRWVYAFAPGERRVLTDTELERQIDAATYVNGDAVRADPR